jgi:hypothetical protein
MTEAARHPVDRAAWCSRAPERLSALGLDVRARQAKILQDRVTVRRKLSALPGSLDPGEDHVENPDQA